MDTNIQIIINGLTILFVMVIFIISLVLASQVRKGNAFLKKWRQGKGLKSLPQDYPGLHSLVQCYKDSIKIESGSGVFKTQEKAEDYFHKSQILRAIGANPNLMTASPSLISGLGVLGTFVGLAISVMFFNSEDSVAIMDSIKTLLSGMGTAFTTSIVGMVASSIYIWTEKRMSNNICGKLEKLCMELDAEHYLSAAELAKIEMNKQKRELLDEINKLREDNIAKTEELKNIFISNDDEGFIVKPGNLLLDIYEEATKQSQSLSSFTTDLSNQLNSSLVKSMDTSIVPLIKNIELTHGQLIAKIESLGESMSSPAGNLVGNVVTELKSSMGDLVNEFKNGITEETSEKMAFLADRLATTGECLNLIPKTMENMTSQMANRFSDIQVIIENLQNSSLKISQETMLSMQGQMNSVTEALSSAVDGLQEQQQAIVEQNRRANDTAIDRLKGQFDEIMVSFKSLADKVENQHEEMLGRQSTSLKEVERMLGSFNSSIELLRSSNNEAGATLSKLTDVSAAIDISSTNLRELASTMAKTADELAKQQDERLNEFKAIQESNSALIEEIKSASQKARDLMATYTGEYPVIKEGLTEIFCKVSEGLQEYSKTIRTSTGNALAEYATALETSTKALQNIAVNLNETAEELTDSIDNFKKGNK